jgi:hypothetical protein
MRGGARSIKQKFALLMFGKKTLLSVFSLFFHTFNRQEGAVSRYASVTGRN